MKKSVLFITPSFFPNLGGVETHVYHVAKELVEKGWHVSVLTTKVANPQDPDIAIKLHRLITDPLNKKKVWKELEHFSKDFSKFDVIHVHDVGWWLLPCIFAIRHKTFITFHGWEGQYPVRWQAKLQRLVLSVLTKGSIHVGGFIQEFYWDRPDLVTYGGVEPSSAKPKSISDKPNVIFLGRLEQENAIEMYIKFFKLLKKTALKPTITWVGNGSYKKECQKIGEVTGMVKDVSKYIKSADIVCANSYLAMLSAQAAAKIVCALYQHLLKQRYLETYPGASQMLIRASASDLINQVLSLTKVPEKSLKMAKEAQSFANTQTWKYVTTQYEQLWNK